MKLHRTAGPLGRLFGFTAEIGKLRFSFNAGWYALVLNWQGSWYVDLAVTPWQLGWYRKGSESGSWPK